MPDTASTQPTCSWRSCIFLYSLVPLHCFRSAAGAEGILRHGIQGKPVQRCLFVGPDTSAVAARCTGNGLSHGTTEQDCSM